MSKRPTWQDRRTARQILALTRGDGATILLASSRKPEKVLTAYRALLHQAETMHRDYWSDR